MRRNRNDVTRCEGITKSGERCKNRGRYPKGYCPLHIEQARRLSSLTKGATLATIGAGAITIIEKTIEIWPSIFGGPGANGTQMMMRDCLINGEFDRLRQVAESQGGPISLNRRRMVSKPHQLAKHLSRLEKLNVSDRQQAGRAIAKTLGYIKD
ncbi:MAG: DUF5763 domain-containing protein [Erythrobacter sp.]